MNDETQMLSFFDPPADSRLYDSAIPVDTLKKELVKFGLTPNESKIFIFLGKYGSKTAREVSEIISLPRTETYRILANLQNKGVISSTFGHPTRFSPLSINDALEVLVRTEIEQAKILQSQKDGVIDLWNALPSFGKDISRARDEKFQILKGQSSIINKIKEMINGVQKNLLLLGPERYFMKLYHTDSLDLLENSSAEIRILASLSSAKSIHVFSKLSQANVRKLPHGIHDNLCFMVKDGNEMISFIKNDVISAQDLMAVRTDSLALTYSMTLLFNNIWSGSTNFDPCQEHSHRCPKPLFSDTRCLQ